MSTICKLEPMIRVNRRARAQLLRYPPKPPKDSTAMSKFLRILAELRIIQQHPALTGGEKQGLFESGAHKLAKL